MNIVFLIDSLDVGGAERVLLSYVKLLKITTKHHITVVTNKASRNSFIKHEVEAYADCKVLVDEFSGCNRWWWNIKKSIVRKYRLKQLLKHTDLIIDFLDADFYKYIKSSKKPKITFLHLSYKRLLCDKKNIEHKCGGYDMIISICQSINDEISECNPVWKDRIRLIYNPFDFESMNGDLGRHLDENVNDDEVLKSDYIVTVSRLDEGSKTKDITTLLSAYAYAYNRGVDYNLVIVGDGPDRLKLENLASELGVLHRVYFVGIKKNPYLWMKNARGFILSSRSEGFPTVLIEAMYFNGSLISTDCPTGPSEILKNGKIGRLCKILDVADMGEAMLNLPPKVQKEEALKYSKEVSMRALDKVIKELML